MWDLEEVCGLAAAGLVSRARALDEEGAVVGIDGLGEVALHGVLREGLGAARGDGSRYGVLGEERYPGDRVRTRRSEGERCDVVLVGDAAGPGRLLDPLEAGTLFAEVGVEAGDALWVEVKVAGQFALVDGIGRANPRYSSILLREVAGDARKLARDPVIRDGAVMVVMFCESEAVAAHDTEVWWGRGVERGLWRSAPVVRGFPLTDRIGNGFGRVVAVRVG